jgi:hypothetical protein
MALGSRLTSSCGAVIVYQNDGFGGECGGHAAFGRYPRLKLAKNQRVGFEEGVDGNGGTLGAGGYWHPGRDEQCFLVPKLDDRDDRADAGSKDGR